MGNCGEPEDGKESNCAATAESLELWRVGSGHRGRPSGRQPDSKGLEQEPETLQRINVGGRGVSGHAIEVTDVGCQRLKREQEEPPRATCCALPKQAEPTTVAWRTRAMQQKPAGRSSSQTSSGSEPDVNHEPGTNVDSRSSSPDGGLLHLAHLVIDLHSAHSCMTSQPPLPSLRTATD